MEKLAGGGCNCHRVGGGGGRIDGCLSMHTASQWGEVLGPDGDLLEQNLKNRMLIDYKKVETEIGKVGRRLAEITKMRGGM